MCSIFRCFGWALDVIQRIISFMMAGVICCAICVGCIVAAGAGVAYGYNVSLAEFLDIKRSDITVYIRRGQFSDRPDVNRLLRRSGQDDNNDLFSSNYTVDYQEHRLGDDSKPLSDAWQKVQDTRSYADKLTKYSKMKSNIVTTSSKDEDDLDELVEDRATQMPALSKSVPFILEKSHNDINMRRLYQDPQFRPTLPQLDTVDKTNVQNEINSNSKRTHRHMKKKKIPDIKVEVHDKSVYLQPNASKFLFSREDFKDAEEIDTIQKPL